MGAADLVRIDGRASFQLQCAAECMVAVCRDLVDNWLSGEKVDGSMNGVDDFDSRRWKAFRANGGLSV